MELLPSWLFTWRRTFLCYNILNWYTQIWKCPLMLTFHEFRGEISQRHSKAAKLKMDPCFHHLLMTLFLIFNSLIIELSTTSRSGEYLVKDGKLKISVLNSDIFKNNNCCLSFTDAGRFQFYVLLLALFGEFLFKAV